MAPTSTASRRDRSRPDGGGAAAPKRRDALLDNAKFLLIVLVVVGHVISPATDTRLADAVYFWIYLFHMPAFVLISGYLSKSFDGGARRVDRLLTTVAAPYLIFWGIYALQSLTADRGLPDTPLEPLWLTWFLAALFVWRLTVPIWRRIRHPLPVAVLVSLAAGVVETGEAFGMSRILSLLPFFVLGLLLEPHHFDFLRQRWVRTWSVGVVLITAAMSYVYLEQLSLEWVYWRESLLDRDVDVLPIGISGRLVFMVLAASLTAALLSLTPRRTTWFTGLGTLTMYVFLLHGLPIRIAEQFGWYEFTEGHWGLALNTAVAVALVFLLLSPWVRRAAKWAVEPSVEWMLRRAPDRGDRERNPV
ncbi:fucose 4-O-acetylase-like acetyltransferase [Spinactinospora alkalitolerans]|uniref:Fucose 4-O-acetylase-like acetyltransferase n=1 Tax=Spinactinospora alkalitolerans TaxID=687207 RepID=A0A852U661_9ACTN|nr:acyltransferase family protein [Spinactinospora alkalitolerans]NYE49564.1 fucose 4-O-acetylase-like acetyltransferase [Spinactinospora alkalitolerans]